MGGPSSTPALLLAVVVLLLPLRCEPERLLRRGVRRCPGCDPGGSPPSMQAGMVVVVVVHGAQVCSQLLMLLPAGQQPVCPGVRRPRKGTRGGSGGGKERVGQRRELGGLWVGGGERWRSGGACGRRQLHKVGRRGGGGGGVGGGGGGGAGEAGSGPRERGQGSV